MKEETVSKSRIDALKSMMKKESSQGGSPMPQLPKIVELLMQYQKIMSSLFSMEQLNSDPIVAYSKSIVTVGRGENKTKAFNLESPKEVMEVLRHQLLDICTEIKELVDDPISEAYIVDKDLFLKGLDSMLEEITKGGKNT